MTEKLKRNLIIVPQDIKPLMSGYEVIGVFNAGVIRVEHGIVLLLRIAERPIQDKLGFIMVPIVDEESGLVRIKDIKLDATVDTSDPRKVVTVDNTYLTSISHFRISRSLDGIQFITEDQAAMFPTGQYESYGIEDPRITELDGVFHITYSAISKYGINTALATTIDFINFERVGLIFHADNKDVTIFPEVIGGKYYALHRPSCSHFAKLDMWIAESPNVITWGNHQHLIGCREGLWDSGRIGASAVPFRIDEGWLEIYHGADHQDRYCLGAVLLDRKKPWQVLARTTEPILEPTSEFENEGFFGDVVFSCGALFEDRTVKIYYGAADTCMAYVEISLDSILEKLRWIGKISV